MKIKLETLTHILSKILGENIIRAGYQAKQLQGGTLGEIFSDIFRWPRCYHTRSGNKRHVTDYKKTLHLNTLQKIYEMRDCNANR